MFGRDAAILLNLFALIGSLALGGYFYRRNQTDLRHIYFYGIALCLAFAAAFELKSLIAQPHLRLRWFALTSIPILFMPACTFNFLSVQTMAWRDPRDRRHYLTLIPPILLSGLLAQVFLGQWLTLDWQISGDILLITLPFPLWLLEMSGLLLLLTGISPLLYLQEQRPFARAVAAALSMPLVLLFFFQLLLHQRLRMAGLTFDLAIQPGLVPIWGIATGLLLAILVIKHRTLDFERVASRTLVLSALTLVLSASYVVLENLLESFFAGIIARDSKFYEMLAALVIAASFSQVHERITKLVEELFEFFRGGQDLEHRDNHKPLLRGLFIFLGIYYFLLVLGKMHYPVPGRISYLISGTLLAATFIHLAIEAQRLAFHPGIYALFIAPVSGLYVLFVQLAPTSPWHPWLNGPGLLLLCALAMLIGRLISWRIDDPAFLIPLLIVGSLMDIWSVARGVTHQMIATKSVALDYLLVRYPSMHRPDVGQLIGFADLLFAVILLGCAVRFGFAAGRTVLCLNLGFVSAFAAVAVTGVGLPALPFISVFFVLLHRKSLPVRREDMITTAIVLVGAAGVLYLVMTLRSALH